MATPARQDGDNMAAARRDGAVLVLSGALERAAVAGVWRQALPLLAGVQRIDLASVRHVDSAGLALVAELAARCNGAGVDGMPAGLGELRAAYRLTDDLTFNG